MGYADNTVMEEEINYPLSQLLREEAEINKEAIPLFLWLKQWRDELYPHPNPQFSNHNYKFVFYNIVEDNKVTFEGTIKEWREIIETKLVKTWSRGGLLVFKSSQDIEEFKELTQEQLSIFRKLLKDYERVDYKIWQKHREGEYRKLIRRK